MSLPELPLQYEGRVAALEQVIASLRPLVVAFSGGVDSSALVAVARSVLGDDVIAVTGVSPSLARRQLEQARRVAAGLGIHHVELPTLELSRDDYAANPTNRCYFCKDELYGAIAVFMSGRGFHVADGTNSDDLKDHRPGREAARRHGVRSPFVEAGFDKSTIRRLSEDYRLETAQYPAEPCLASRLAYGLRVTQDRLSAVEQAEAAVRAAGFRELRVRHLGDSARIEISAAELGRAQSATMAQHLRSVVAAVGFADVEIDSRPLRSGRLIEEAS